MFTLLFGIRHRWPCDGLYDNRGSVVGYECYEATDISTYIIGLIRYTLGWWLHCSRSAIYASMYAVHCGWYCHLLCWRLCWNIMLLMHCWIDIIAFILIIMMLCWWYAIIIGLYLLIFILFSLYSCACSSHVSCFWYYLSSCLH